MPVLVLANWRTSGLAGARNTGILALDTELVAFCDDDDGGRRTSCAARSPRCWPTRTPSSPPARSRSSTTAGRTAAAGRAQPGHASTTWPAPGWRCCTRPRSWSAGPRSPQDGIGLVAEDAPGSQNEDWDLLLRAARRAPIVHVDEPLVRVLWGRSSHFAYEYATKISSLRWMMQRHPEISGCRPGAARVYGQLACWSAATGNRSQAWQFSKAAVRATGRSRAPRSRWPP